MTDAPVQDATPAATSTLTSAPRDSSAQMIVALATVICMGVISIGALVVAALCRENTTVVVAAIAVPVSIAGALANSLAAPTGIASVISSARNRNQP